MKEAMKSGKIGISLDLWSDKFRNVTYMGSMAHYITYNEEEKKPQLVTRLLALTELDAEEAKTADFLHNHIVGMFHEFDLQDQPEKIVFISDRGKNIVN